MNTQLLRSFLQSPENLGKDAGVVLDRLTREFPYFQTAQLLYVKSLHNDNSFLYNNQLKLAAAYTTDRKVLYELIRKKHAVTVTPVPELPEVKPVAEVVPEVKPVIEVIPETVSTVSEKAIAAADLIQETPVTNEAETTISESASVQLTANQLLKARLNKNTDEWDESVLRQLQLLRLWQKDPTSGSGIDYSQKQHTVPVPEKTAEPIPEIVIPETVPVVEPVAELVIETAVPETENENIEASIAFHEMLTVLIDGESEDIDEAAVELQLPESDNQEIINEEAEETFSYEIVTLETVSETVIHETVTEPEEIPATPKHSHVPEDLVDQEILIKAIGSSIELEVSSDMLRPEDLQPVVAQTETETETQTETETETERETERQTETERPETEQKPQADEKITFSNWLKQLNQPVAEVNEKAENTTTVPSGSLQNELQNELIDKFIEAEPRMTPQKTAFYNPANMAKKSVTDDYELVTETLAKVYEKQGNLPKAIRVYQRLSLKYPEKSIYFASLIEKLKSTPNKNTK